MKRNLAILTILLFGGLSGVNLSIQAQSNENNALPSIVQSETVDAEVRPFVSGMVFTNTNPIIASGNAGFDTVVTNLGLPGNGSAINPYIIEGYNISGFFSTAIQLIGSINYYIVIRNNLLSNIGSFGIDVFAVNNIVIESNTIIQPSSGLYLRSSSGLTIYNNTIIGPSAFGIYLSLVSDFDVDSNVIEESQNSGIYATSVNNYNIRNNDVIDSGNDGIYSSGSGNISPNNITGNLVEDASKYGIYVVNDNNNTISDNDVSSTTYYANIYLSSSANNTIENNILSFGGIGFGVSTSAVGTLGQTMQTSVQNNLLDGKVIRYQQGVSNVLIQDDNSVGQVILIDVNTAVISGLSLAYVDVAIAAYFSTAIEVSNNEFMDVGRSAIELEETTNSQIWGNTISGSRGGIKLVDVDTVDVTDNFVADVGYEAVKFDNINWTIISNNVLIGSLADITMGTGIYGYSAYNSQFNGNYITNLGNDGIMIQNGNSNSISGNFIYYSEDGINLGYVDNTVITDNIISAARGASISVMDIDGLEIYGNSLLNIGRFGFQASGMTNMDFYDNIITGDAAFATVEINQAYALLFSHSNDNVSLTNNDFKGESAGLSFDISFAGADINGNYYSDYDGSGSYEIDGGANLVDLNPVSSPIHPEPSFTLTNSGDVTYDAGNTTSQMITWTTNDRLNVYRLFQNDQLVEIGSFDGSQFSVDVTGFSEGTYIFSLEMINYYGGRVRSTAVVRVNVPDVPETITVTGPGETGTVTVTDTTTDTTTVTTGGETETNSTGGGSDDSGIGFSVIQTAFVTSLAFITLIVSRRKLGKF